MFENMMENELLLRFVMPPKRLDDPRHPASAVTVGDDATPLMHDLHTLAIEINHSARIWNLGYGITIPAPACHRHTLLKSKRITPLMGLF
jgi:hypothetical protein